MFRQAISTTSKSLRPSILTSRAPLRSPAYTPSVLPRPLARWYSESKETPSTEGDKVANGDKSNGEAKSEPSEADVVAELRKNLEAKDAEARDWKDKCLRTVADFRNLQDRTAREVKTAREFAIQKFAKDLVDSVDNLDRALATVPADKLTPEGDKDLANLHEGLVMTEAILMQTLARHGLERVSPEGDKFNPNEHEATFMAPQEGKEDGTVFFVQQKGFKLNGRVLRAAKVGVVKNT